MTSQFTSHQIQALRELANFRSAFKNDSSAAGNMDKKAPGNAESVYQANIDRFTEIFCENNFADADYSSIQNELLQKFVNNDALIEQLSLEKLLKCFTYVIWTNRTVPGYFVTKIQDNTVDKYLKRLEDILSAHSKQIKLEGTNVRVINPSREHLNINVNK